MVDAMKLPPLLARGFYQRPTEVVARELLGKLLGREHPQGTVAVRLTEVEAYLGVDDAACHTFGGRRTARTETMWGAAGHAYVYLVCGLHSCLNVVTVGCGRPEAVLIRGGMVEHGLELARARRGAALRERALADGPGKLCRALAVSRAQDGADLCDRGSGLVIRDDGLRVGESSVRRLPRVGVAYAGAAAAWPLRMLVDADR